MLKVVLPRPAIDAARRRYDAMAFDHAVRSVQTLDLSARPATNSVDEHFPEGTLSHWKSGCVPSRLKYES